MNWKRLLVWLSVAFFIYAIVVSPERAADIVQNIWGLVVDAFQAIVRFIEALAN